MRYFLLLSVFALFLSFGVSADAQIDDYKNPSERSECDGLDCISYGLCDPYCEDLECDTKEGFEKNPKICNDLLEKYQKKTGYPGPPCVCDDVCNDEQIECKSECKPNDIDCLADCCESFFECQQDCCEQAGERNCVTDFCAIAP